MEKIKKILNFWLPPFLWMGLIFFLSSFHKLQVSSIGWQDFITRKTAHFLEYYILFLLFFRAFKNTSKIPFPRILFLSLILTLLYSITDEFHQTFINGRSGKIFDIGVDFLGATFGAYFVIKLLPKSPQKIKSWFKKINVYYGAD